MTKTRLVRAVLALFAGAALLSAGYFAGSRHAAGTASTGAAATAISTAGDKIDPKTGRKVLYWHDPMVPNQHFDKPGKSPFMDMQLEPVFADEGGGSTGIKIDPGLQQNLGIRYATVRRQETTGGFDAVGTTQFDESRTDVVQSRVTGYIDRLYASAPMQRVAKGAPIASLFVPDWLAPQEEYLALRRGWMDGSLLDASRARMRALSIPDGLIAALDRTGKAQTHIVLTSPEAGVVSELNVRDGAMVTPGQTLAKISGLSKLWLIVEIPEALALDARPGLTIDATFPGDPTQHFTGRIREVLPGISTSSRTLQARLELDNSALKLTPGMLMRVRVGGQKAVPRLLVPSEAVITTGKRSVVILKNADGRLQPVSVTVGNDVGNETEVLDGLKDGDTVVASGQFLIDSEASLKSVLPRLEGGAGANASAPASAPASAVQTYETTGKVEKVTATDITFSHQAVPALGWGAMTMAFNKPAPNAFPDVKVGQPVHFVFKQTDDGYQLTKVEPVGGVK
ncbi:TPA: efflux RND transporter periplasmic adaptor subunit [Burkholderia contaminans]|nr:MULTISPECIES: efflux RND transporter periplasmic adaptor subunit [Burkholderia cepacia complex]KVS22096.1 RND transporter MFP subunit [Burkholderia vietnamiensis]MBM6430578.1 efflux RND transporter periplasmic adaptor subunit [Burkholderia contaminans]MCA7880839.1 efflux RND transporter periplasmic adaptor subunit [Burkholderia contaminans]MCB4349257.1 efflux RND transporter periplasmic adaptor subunit [Burkholderia vietnamiensis]MDN8025837.1 efflux RND transporter periplasmic adaptor subun